MTQWTTSIVSSLGVIGVAFLIAVDNLFPPFPQSSSSLLTGFLVGRGEFTFTVALIAATGSRGRSTGALCAWRVARLGTGSEISYGDTAPG